MSPRPTISALGEGPVDSREEAALLLGTWQWDALLAKAKCILSRPLFPGSVQDLKNKRNPRLVPYALLDERTKKSNRDSLREAVRTFVGYGYNIEPSDQELGNERRSLVWPQLTKLLGKC